MIRRHSRLAFRLGLSAFAWLAVAGATGPSRAADCTDGVDCYCDHVRNSSDPLYDPNVLVCEDFEAPTLYDDLPAGNQTNAGGQNVWGPWWDDTGFAGDRGHNSYWAKTFGNGTSGFWKYPSPSSPKRGKTCQFGPGSPNGYQGCSGMIPYHPSNLWDGNDQDPKIYIQRAGDYNKEVSTLKDPGVWQGKQFFSARVKSSGAILGAKNFPAITNLGVTEAFGVSSNLASSPILNLAWKGNEFGQGQFWLFGYQQNAPDDSFPFSGFMFYAAGKTQTDCNANKGTAVVGSVSCNPDTAMLFWATSPTYSRSRDWPDGTWGCVRGYVSGMGTSDMRIQEWFEHFDGSGETLVLDIQHINSSFLMDQSVGAMYFDTYSNQTSNVGPLPETVYRYEDNLHVRNGSPVSCAAIGFNGTAPPTSDPPPSPPAAPILLQP